MQIGKNPFLLDSIKKHTDAASRDRRVTVVVFALFFSWLLAVPFEGRVLYELADFHGVSAQSYLFGAMAAHFTGLVACGFFVRNIRAAKMLILISIALCAAATGVLFLKPSPLWTVALLLASFAVGGCVAAWGFFFKSSTHKKERMKTIADCLIFSNLLMILLNIAATHITPQTGLTLSIAALFAAFLFAFKLPKESMPKTQGESPVLGNEAVSASKFGALAFLCLFIVIITINSGLMYQVVNPAFAHLRGLASWYWALPYVGALIVMRFLPQRINRTYALYVGIAWIGFSFIAFLLLRRTWADYLVVNTLLLGACGIFDLFWWSILGDMLEMYKNPAKIIGTGLAANVFGVLLGGIIGNALTAGDSDQNYTLIALSVVCVTLVMLPPLHKRLTGLLKSHVYLTAFAEMPGKEQERIVYESSSADLFTEREREVVLLLIKGKPNREIADELFISERTVKYHVANIYSKTGATSKAELANLILRKPFS